MSLSKLQNTLASINNEFTAAAANFRFDFTLIKYEAPKEYLPLGQYLPSRLKEDAEHGKMHVTAQRLGALFDEVCPATPHLVKAYGTRVSAIAESVQHATSKLQRDSIFSAFSGTDGASIWAAATSSTAALQVQLLACMVARVWPPDEAQSLWIEITKERRKDIATRFEAGEEVAFPTLSAARQLEISKSEIAYWDASARAWLRIADEVKSKEQKKLMLVLDEGILSVGKGRGTYKDVIEAWTTAMTGMERLLTGAPQATQQGAIVIGLSAWHLYPNLVILKSDRPEMAMNDPLFTVPGAVLTIGLEQTQATSPTGIFWSLSLAHLRHYGPPVLTKREFSRASTRLSFAQLAQATLGAVLETWGCSTREELVRGANIILRLRSLWCDCSSKCGSQSPEYLLSIRDPNHWMNLLGDAASELVAKGDSNQENVYHIMKLGQRRSRAYIGPSNVDLAPFWELQSHELILEILMSSEDKVRYMREVSARALLGEDLIIRHEHVNSDMRAAHHYVSVFPRPITPNKRKSDPNPDDPFDLSVYSRPPESTISSMASLRSRQYGIIIADNPWQPGDVEEITLEQGQLKITDTAKKVRHYSFLFGDSDRAGVWMLNGGASRPFTVKPLVSQPSLDSLESALRCESLMTCELIAHISELSSRSSAVSRTFQCLEKAASVYASLSGATISVEVLNHPLYVANWAASSSPPQTNTMTEPETLHENVSVGADDAFVHLKDISLPAIRLSTPDTTLDNKTFEPDHLASDADEQVIAQQMVDSNFGWDRYLQTDISNSNAPSKLQLMVSRQRDAEDCSLTREASLSCIAYFEGCYNIPPVWLRDVFAISSSDSLYIDAQLLRDPSDFVKPHQMKRILGNVGRPGITMLIPPSDPMIRKLDPGSWTVVNHNPFDGRAGDFFNRTTLHLSFTEHEFVRSGVPLTANRDASLHSVEKQITFLESLISVHSGGVWQADVDILKALNSPHVQRIAPDTDPDAHQLCHPTGRGLTSAQTWEEILDPPNRSFVVNASDNWNARLAATAVLAQLCQSSQNWKQRCNSVVVCQPSMCWRCATCLDEDCKSCKSPGQYDLTGMYHTKAIIWVH